jgi:hypothetical protein
VLVVPLSPKPLDDGGGFPAVDSKLLDELGMLPWVGEAAVAADVVGQVTPQVVDQESLSKASEEVVPQDAEALAGG